MKRVFIAAAVLVTVLPGVLVGTARPAAAALRSANTATTDYSHFVCNVNIEDANHDGDWFWTATETVTYHYACQVPNEARYRFADTMDAFGANVARRVDGGPRESGGCRWDEDTAIPIVDSEAGQQLRFHVTLPTTWSTSGTGYPTGGLCHGTSRAQPLSGVWEILASSTQDDEDTSTWDPGCYSPQPVSAPGDTSPGPVLASGESGLYANGEGNGCLQRIRRVNTSLLPSMPTDYYSGGSPVDPVSGRASETSCTQKTFQDKDGGWWVTLSARTFGSRTSGARVQKAWTATWDSEDGLVGRPLEADADNTVTLPLPAINSRPNWGWIATYHERVKMPAGVLGQPVGKAEHWQQDEDGKWDWTTPQWAAAFAAANGAAWTGAATAGVSASAGTAVGLLAAGSLSYYATHKFLNTFVGAAPDVEPVTLGPRAKGFTPTGARFFNGTTQTAHGEYWTEYELTCRVVVAPDNPPSDTKGTGGVDPGDDDDDDDDEDEPAGPDGDGACSAGILGRIPFFGGVFDGFARGMCGVVDAIGRLAGFLIDGIRRLFIPDNLDVSGFTDIGCEEKFPCLYMPAFVELLGDLADAASSGLANGACFAPVGFSVQGHTFSVKLPTPSDSGCPGNGEGGARTTGDNQAGDLFGHRGTVRSVLSVLLWAGFIRKVYGQLPWAKNDDLPSP